MTADLSIYLKAVQDSDGKLFQASDSSIAEFLRIHKIQGELPELDEARLAIVGIKESRFSNGNESSAYGVNHVREELYSLYVDSDRLSIVDLGDIEAGHELEDSLFALEQVCSHLIARDIIPVVIGGEDYCSLGIYRAYCKLERSTNIVSIDPLFDVNDQDGPLGVHNHISRLILHKPGFLFNYTNIGYQTYLVHPRLRMVMDKMFFDTHRLGEVNQDIREMEPVLRNADTVFVDMKAVRASDSPGHISPLPNGLYGEQLCQLCAMAGMNEKLSAIGFFGYNPEYDIRNQSAALLAQAIWCFIDGYLDRHMEDLDFHSDAFTRFRVALDEGNEIVFYKSKITERWWLEVPSPPSAGNRFKRSRMVPCSYKDYETACAQEVPDRWWQTYQKLN